MKGIEGKPWACIDSYNLGVIAGRAEGLEESRRAADRELRQKIHAEILEDILSAIEGEKTKADSVMAIIDKLVARHIRHVRITY